MNFIFDKIEERDVDFTIMRAFSESTDFTALFLQKIGYNSGTVISIEHSFTDNDLGESDITVIVMTENKKLALLIENKIDAKAMDEQCSRYDMRGNKGIDSGEYDEFATFIIAPKSYIENNLEAQKYKNSVLYEEIAMFFQEHNMLYDAKIIESAIYKQSHGYTIQEVPAITEFWIKLYDYCCSSNKHIEMYKAEGPKGARSTWPQFKSPLKGTALYYKANQGVCDLQFSGKLNDSLRLKTELAKFKTQNMHWTDTGASVSLRIKVLPIDFRKPFESFTEEVDIMMNAIEELTALSVTLNDVGYIV